MMIRQGDYLLRQIGSIPGFAVPERRDGDLIIGEGELTGHAHRIKSLQADRFFTSSAPGDRTHYLRVNEPVALTHEEHGTVEVPVGNYQVVHQREYDGQRTRSVED